MRYVSIIVSCLLLLVSTATAKTIYMGPSESYTNLSSAFNAMVRGDTLIIRNGIYTGNSNQIRVNNSPPSGSGVGSGDSRFTIIKAENPGQVTLGNGSSVPLDIKGNSYGNGPAPKWIKIEGIIFESSGSMYLANGDNSDLTSGDYGSSYDMYWYFKGCGFHDRNGSESGTVWMLYMNHILLEDCFSWGRARYGLQTFRGDKIIVRRHIDRRDAVQTSSSCPTSNFMNYNGHYVEFQNSIAIDTDAQYWSSAAGNYGNFYVRNSYSGRRSQDTGERGNIVVNTRSNTGGQCFGGNIGGLYAQSDTQRTQIEHMIFWSTSSGIWINGGSGHSADHVTLGPSSSGGSLGITGVSNTNTNTWTNNQYNYIFKPEQSFPFGNDGEKVGAEVLYKYGVDGTFYGQTGYKDVQPKTPENRLWPWGVQMTGDNTWEKVIWEKMRQDYDPSPEIRGFTQTSQSVTKWVSSGGNTLTQSNPLGVDGSGGTSIEDVTQYIYDGDPIQGLRAPRNFSIE